MVFESVVLFLLLRSLVFFFFFSSGRRDTRCALVTEFRRVLFRSSQIFASGPMAIAHPIKCWKAGPDFRMNICAAIFAHNEERRIGSCLKSLPLDRMDIAFHVLVNGSNDRTADRAR